MTGGPPVKMLALIDIPKGLTRANSTPSSRRIFTIVPPAAGAHTASVVSSG